ncbi:membrane protein [Porphyromonas crevioricanis]|uniref:Membrane protein n=2 Tax=Porphyromonas crevioricanis TaxID=393921 RepID=A0A0A2FPG9_9PORP|nr:OmpA family protein [Porphyromonas crevioricanis]KGN91282.1 membrane protein [Porphyromonas crevioricanis]KGN93016.1 membrane protein [Porphyromonas crevioricanis]SJZ85747.1 Outer membrane protein OmpA [Porphyromonas crevioricanis]SQH72995.1 PG33 [Porphyromonas crevioricanis]GAD05379.1 immunoreactive 42 kDa antigen PG33 [Porphyromonas crevioricanis JCM 15906]
MKARILLLAIASSTIFLTANAQEPMSQNQPGKNTTFARDKASDHWFVDLQGGVGIALFGSNRDKKEYMERYSITPTLSVGKWHEPYFGTRLQVMGWNMKGFYNEVSGSQGLMTGLKANNLYGAAHFDFLFDATNYFGVYRPDKFFRVIPFVGLGAGYKIKSTNEEDKIMREAPEKGKENEEGRQSRLSPTLNGGVMLKFRLSSCIDLNLEAQTMLSRMRFIGTDNDKAISDVNSYLTAGLTINLGKTTWDEVVPMDYNMIKDLNSQLNALRAQNEELNKRPVSCPECPEASVSTTKKVVVNNVVYFRLNSAQIDRPQMVNIYNTAEYAKKNNQDVYIVGYADRDTGTAAYNKALSERRAKAVAEVLTKKYGIDASRIKIEWKGSDEQVYAENAWNRVVIMNVE